MILSRLYLPSAAALPPITGIIIILWLDYSLCYHRVGLNDRYSTVLDLNNLSSRAIIQPGDPHGILVKYSIIAGLNIHRGYYGLSQLWTRDQIDWEGHAPRRVSALQR